MPISTTSLPHDEHNGCGCVHEAEEDAMFQIKMRRWPASDKIVFTSTPPMRTLDLGVSSTGEQILLIWGDERSDADAQLICDALKLAMGQTMQRASHGAAAVACKCEMAVATFDLLNAEDDKVRMCDGAGCGHILRQGELHLRCTGGHDVDLCMPCAERDGQVRSD